jgi:uncharacterized protein (TIGR00730 family)
MTTQSQEPIVTVFGSSRPRVTDAAYAEARLLGAELAARGFSICTGGYGEVMEAVSRGAKQAGGHTFGVTAESFQNRANNWIDQEIRVKTWQERLFELVRRGDAYVACAGGTGTLAELAVVWEMLHKRVMPIRPFVVLGQFWAPVIECVRSVEFAGAGANANSEPCNESIDSFIKIISGGREAAEFLARRIEPTELPKNAR